MTTSSSSSTPPEHLAIGGRYVAAVDAGLADAMPTAEPYAHLYELVADYPSRGGKRLRPSICLAACEAYGSSPDEVIELAVALELLHNAFLVHDDIEDASVQRRGRPAVHVLAGIPRALNAGDALAGLALDQLGRGARRHGRIAADLMAEFAHLFRRTTEGQATELGWATDDRWDVDEDDYLAMVRDKTCWYSVIHPMRIGALVATGGQVDLDRLIALGFLIGAVFQIHDDLENLLYDATYGKDGGGDLVEGKRTLPLLHFFREAGAEDREEVRALLGPSSGAAAAERVAVIVPKLERSGSLAYARVAAQALSGAAIAEFGRAFDGCAINDGLRFLAAVVTDLHDRATSLVA
jgi:geranylgeranyl diphosphate synthase type II